MFEDIWELKKEQIKYACLIIFFNVSHFQEQGGNDRISWFSRNSSLDRIFITNQ